MGEGTKSKGLSDLIYSLVALLTGVILLVMSLSAAKLFTENYDLSLPFWEHLSSAGKMIFVWFFGLFAPASSIVFFIVLPNSLKPLLQEVEQRGGALNLDKRDFGRVRVVFAFARIAAALRNSELAQDQITWGPKIEKTLNQWEWVFSVYLAPLIFAHSPSEMIVFGSVVIMVLMKFKSILLQFNFH